MLLFFLILWKHNYREYFEASPKPTEKDYTTLDLKKMNHTFYGDIVIYENPKDTICGLVSNNKIWESHHIEKFKKYYTPNTDILDIGANIGLSSLGFHKKYGITGTVHLFEPQYHAMFCCSYNTRSIPKRKLYNFALSDKENIISFNTAKNNVGGTGMTYSQFWLENVLCTQLDNIDFKDKISLVKIDVEGAELSLIKGGLKTIGKHKPNLIIEIWKETTRDEIDKLLFAMGYKRVENIHPDYIYSQ
jgi:FkbM family methyltransferase